MAQVLGKAGRYVNQQVGTLRRQISYRVSAAIAFLGIVQGLLLSHYLPVYQLPPLLFGVLAVAVLVFIWRLDRYLARHIDDLKQQCRNYERGLAGESQVTRILAKLPHSFHIINDLTTPFGNLDHVVVGPTGVFILDAKNWRGIVTADGRGELLLNNRPTDKPPIRPFVARIMGVRDKVCALAPGCEPYLKAVLVFTAARVEARWGETGQAHCLTDEQLHDYLVNQPHGIQLPPDHVATLSQAFLALATMDREFQPKPAASFRKPALPPLPPRALSPSSVPNPKRGRSQLRNGRNAGRGSRSTMVPESARMLPRASLSLPRRAGALPDDGN